MTVSQQHPLRSTCLLHVSLNGFWKATKHQCETWSFKINSTCNYVHVEEQRQNKSQNKARSQQDVQNSRNIWLNLVVCKTSYRFKKVLTSVFKLSGESDGWCFGGNAEWPSGPKMWQDGQSLCGRYKLFIPICGTYRSRRTTGCQSGWLTEAPARWDASPNLQTSQWEHINNK